MTLPGSLNRITKIRSALECAELFAIKNSDQRSAGKLLTILQAAKVELIAMGDADTRKDSEHEQFVVSESTSPTKDTSSPISSYSGEQCIQSEISVVTALQDACNAIENTIIHNYVDCQECVNLLQCALSTGRKTLNSATEPVSIKAIADKLEIWPGDVKRVLEAAGVKYEE